MKLRELIEGLPYLLDTRGDLDTPVSAITANSRERTADALFFCIHGARFDAHDYAAQAVSNGCTALVVERWVDVPVPQILVSSGRGAMSRIAAAFYGHPADRMKLVGITGTKGKTTTSYMLKSIVEQAGIRCGLIGTTGNMIGDKRLEGNLTTPDPIELQSTLRLMADAGVKIVSMEVSAHAIDMLRLDGLTFEVGCYTNLSQDHLDYFHTMEHYFETKRRFFTSGMVRNGAFNADEETTERILDGLQIPHITYGICVNADLFARDIEISENGVSFTTRLQGMHDSRINLQMTGMFNVYNALAAASCAMILGIGVEDIRKGLERIASVPGRVEMLQTGTPYKVILDYSHSPDALQNILETVRVFTRGRVIALFGCGGDRDQGKRPMMGEIGGRLADLCVLTSDNPRSEDPMDILKAIEDGIRPTGKPYVVIENRREAIRYALGIAKDGDVIVLAGKGHETYQEIKGIKHPFDEKAVVAELLHEMEG
ncbi:MAG: UDP-N-acetylmuramoyl-L-alanyl-D-glutamate--2,6-diaminopimelate ligase [Clostridia bacterium]|nr:UDP-N-acetylmuramoyl-L-alanyl-D-glutamate--2,6-diaminopimelate ligase [Clostridia bacterium]MBR4459728.1 UDP-N-acetylmuramoyl-L-alanyl-D-glutamate--2,6-diaminopimelate ligase [Clostridia bacterium]